jgi:hypothetical protein
MQIAITLVPCLPFRTSYYHPSSIGAITSVEEQVVVVVAVVLVLKKALVASAAASATVDHPSCRTQVAAVALVVKPAAR